LYLANPNTDHHGPTLLVTFSRCLVAYLQSLASGFPREVNAENYHKFARGYLSVRNRMRWGAICGPDEVESLTAKAVTELKTEGDESVILGRPTKFLVEEFRWLAQHGIVSAEEYAATARVGRANARVTKADRPIIFAAYERYRKLRSAGGKDYDWEDLAPAVVEEFAKDASARRYRHVVIDEGQDLSPMALRSLAAAIPANGSLTFFGDMAQQIYGTRMSWRSAGLNVQGGIWYFQENYRNTKQIAQLALAIARSHHFRDVADLVEPKSPKADGPPPALVRFKDEGSEIRFVAERAQKLAETGTVAVLFRDREQEKVLRQILEIRATRLHGDLATWPSGPGLFYGTYHAAKGLEFDTVFLPHVGATRLPHPPDVAAFGEEEASIGDSRLLYVGVTRARSTLVLTHTGEPTSLLPMDADLMQRSSR